MTTTTIEQDMERIARNYRLRIEDIRADEDLTLDAKKRRMKEVYEEARTQHGKLYDQQRQELAGKVERRRKEALSPPKKYGSDPETVQLSYRDALDRVSNISESKILSEKLQQAQITGDDVLAKAILARGYELEDESVVGAYFEKYPDHRQTWDRFMGAAQEYNTLEEQGRMFGDQGPEKPREIGGVG